MSNNNKQFKTVPAGKDDRLNLTCTQFASNQERSEIKAPEGREFDNDALLELLGFEKDGKGLKLPTEGHDFEILPNGEILRKDKDGKVLTGSEKEEEVR